MDEIDNLFAQYYELFPIQKENIQDDKNECKHTETTSDESHYYVVCIACGQCLDYANIQHIEFDYIQNATIKRYYKKTNYLKLKLNKIKNLTPCDITIITREFIRYDNLYEINKKKIKYDFILSIILQSMKKTNVIIKKYKSKLEKKRIKEYNQIMGLI
jgi:ferredoxin